MKKSLLALFAGLCLIAISAHAENDSSKDWALAGAEVGWNDNKVMEKTSADIRTITTNCTGEIKFKEVNNWNVTWGSSATTILENNTYNLQPNTDGNIKLENPNHYDLTFVLNIQTGELKVSGYPNIQEPEETWYITGDSFSWADKDTGKMEKIGDNLYSVTTTATGAIKFKTAGEWEGGKNFGGNETIDSNNTYQLTSGGGNLTLINPSNYELTFELDTANGKLTVSGFPSEATDWIAYINGAPVVMPINEDGFPYYDTSIRGSDTTLGRWNLTWRFSNGTRNLTFGNSITENGTYDLVESTQTFSIPNDDNFAYTVTIDPTAEKPVMRITGLNTEVEGATWFLSYNSTAANGWQFNQPMSIQPDDTYMAVINLPQNGQNYLTVTNGGKIFCKQEGNEVKWDVQGTRYSPAPAGGNPTDKIVTASTQNDPMYQVTNGNDKCWILQTEGIWTITVDPRDASNPKISFTKGDIAVVSRKPSHMWMVGSFNEFAIPTESGGSIEPNGAISLAPVLDDEGNATDVFKGTFLWTNEDINVTLVGTYSATDAANWYGPKDQNSDGEYVDVVEFTDADDDGTYSYEGNAAVFTGANGATIDSRYWDIDTQPNMNANTVVTVIFNYRFNDTTHEDESTVEFFYDPEPVIAELDGQKVVYSTDGWQTVNYAPMRIDENRIWWAEIPEGSLVAGKKLLVAFSEKIDDDNTLYYVPATKEWNPEKNKYVYTITPGPTAMKMGKTSISTGVIDQVDDTGYSQEPNIFKESYWEYEIPYSAPIYTALDRNHLLVAFSTETIMTGVESIEAVGEGEVVYFNLQGVRVANPEHGLFIRVSGGKAEKVML